MLSFVLHDGSPYFLPSSYSIEQVDKAIYEFGKRLYQIHQLLLDKPISLLKLKVLIRYKEILENLIFDPLYYGSCWTPDIIDSRIKVLINGLV